MKYDIFISYSRKDAKIVKIFFDALSAAGYSVWMDVDGIESGDEFKRKIVSAIKDSKLFLFFSSVASNASEWTVKEVNVAVALRKPIIPIKLDNTVYDDSLLLDLSGLDFIECGGNETFSTIQKLMRSLQNKIGSSNSVELKDKVSVRDVGHTQENYYSIPVNTTHAGKSEFPKLSFNKKWLVIAAVAIIAFVAVIFGVNWYGDYRAAEAERRQAEIALAEQQRFEEELIAKERADSIEAARKAKEEAERIAAENKRLAQEEAARQAKEEAERLAAENKRLAQEEAERKSKEEAERKRKEAAQTRGTINGHDYVDLGLSVKWATCNVGASSPGDYGDYYAWGETSTKSSYDEDNSATYGKQMGSIAGNPTYDVARKKWGSPWRLPTKAEFDELIDNCTWTRTTQNGHNGYKVTSKKNGNSVFLPAAGWRVGALSYGRGTDGFYWSATPNESDSVSAYYLIFYEGYLGTYCYNRSDGHRVRPVCD